jgi:hypothetical protein
VSDDFYCDQALSGRGYQDSKRLHFHVNSGAPLR